MDRRAFGTLAAKTSRTRQARVSAGSRWPDPGTQAAV